MMMAIVRCLPPAVPSAYDDIRKASASPAVIASSLNQIATLCWSPYSDATQCVNAKRSPLIEPLAEQCGFTGAAAAAADATTGAPALPGGGWPTFHAFAIAEALRFSSAVSGFAISS